MSAGNGSSQRRKVALLTGITGYYWHHFHHHHHHPHYHHFHHNHHPRDLLTALDTYWRKGSNYVQIAIGKQDIVVKIKISQK